MRFVKNRILWITVYATGITVLFLHLLFPSQLVLQRLEAAVNSAGYLLEAGSLRPSLPLGIKLKDVTVHFAQVPSDILFRGESVDLQFNPFSIFRKNKTIRFQSNAYGGSFEGRADVLSFEQINPPAGGEIYFQDIDLSRCSPAVIPLIRGITGRARGSAFYVLDNPATRISTGKMILFLVEGSYALPEPFLGISRIEYDRGEVNAKWQNGSVTLEKFEIFGSRMKCSLQGDIQLAPRLEESRLNLKGVLEISGSNHVKMNVTVGGTLASPSVRYI
ncbi:MAG: type II secretion system protein GspN [Smithellaceae bacterium]|nr:type II secretion system protein GspN [Smithellaceae bacterium]